jgi:hypothetical protein
LKSFLIGKPGMKRESTLTVQSEKPLAYAGRRERQAPAPRLRPPETPYFVQSEAKHRGVSKLGEGIIAETRLSARKIFEQKAWGASAKELDKHD